MIQLLRDKVQGWISMVIIGLLTIPFAFFGISSYISASAGSDAVAKVGGAAISAALFQQAQESNPDMTPQAVLTALIDSELLNQSLLHAGFLEVIDSSSGKTISPVQQLEAGIIQSEFILPHELSALFETRDISYMIISLPRVSGGISDSELRAYYDNHTDAFMTPAQATISYVLLPESQFSKLTNFKQAGFNYDTKLTALARDYNLQLETLVLSQSPQLPIAQVATPAQAILINKDVIAAAFSDQKDSKAVNIPHVGEIIFYRPNPIIPAHPKAFDQVKGRIEQILQKQKNGAALKAQADQQAQEINTGSPWASQPISKTVTRDNNQLDPALLQAAFTGAIGKAQAVELSDGGYAVVQVKSITPPKNLSQGSQAVVQAWIKTHVLQDQANYLQSLRDTVKIKIFQKSLR